MVELGFDFAAMATDCEIRAQAEDEANLREAAEAAIAEVRRIETRYSRFRTDSVIGRINAAAGTAHAVEVDDEALALLRLAGQLTAASHGRFDITAGALARCWDFARGEVPSPSQLDAALALTGWHRVEVEGHRVRLPLAGMALDLGGLGKEYACDRAAAVLLAHGIAAGYVNLGGDIRVLGPHDGGAWRFGLQHPREKDRVLGTVAVAAGGLATSGDYERFFEVDGRRYHHLIDARTGRPVAAPRSVTVLAPTCSAAGAASTLACLAGDDALAFLQAQGVQYVVVDAAGRVHSTLSLGA